ncbi:DMT family transporter [Planktotalea sp.]|uniref:DMT family transporter n=1 Tax=Planktotalea sp. TaxID=2029877 RepID=UPI003D6A64D1
MKNQRFPSFSGKTIGAFGGLYLVLIYCVLATGADAITRTFSHGFEAPQLFCFSGAIVAALSALSVLRTNSTRKFRTLRPRTMALRSLFFILCSLFYFAAFRALPFAEVFVFIAFVPIFAALLSYPILGEPVRWQSWIALIAGAGGMVLLYPEGLAAFTWAHLCAFLGALTGATAMVLARHISKDDKNALLQVLYPNIAICLVMACILPFVYKPMSLLDVLMVISYASLLFLARWVLVLALSHMKAYVVTLLINFQFVIMVLVGALIFGESPTVNLIAGALVIIFAGAYLVLDEWLADRFAGRAKAMSKFTHLDERFVTRRKPQKGQIA